MNGAATRGNDPATRRPLVTVSYAQTLDGRIATSTGSSRWISGEDSLRFCHQLRADHDAIMVGVDTVCKDDPRLTVRHVAGTDPLRVVIDSSLRTPLSSAVLSNGAAAGTILAVVGAAAAPERIEAVTALGTTVLRFSNDADGRVDLTALLAALHERGVRTLMVEGGSRLITSLLRLQVVDRLAVCIAPKLLGSGIEAVGDLGICDLARAVTLVDASYDRCGNDLIVDAGVAYADPPNRR